MVDKTHTLPQWLQELEVAYKMNIAIEATSSSDITLLFSRNGQIQFTLHVQSQDELTDLSEKIALMDRHNGRLPIT